MKRYLCIILFLLIPAIALAGPGSYLDKHNMGFVTKFGGFEQVNYDLQWTGTGAANQTFSDAQVIDTAAEGMQKGSITVTDAAGGTVKVVSEKLEITGTGTWDETGVRETTGVTKALGKALFGKLTHNTSAASLFGLNTAAGIVRANGMAIEFSAADALTVTKDDASATLVTVGAVVDGTTYKLLTLQGGFSASATPFYTGQAVADYTRGLHDFIKGGTFTTWTRIWTAPTDNTGTLYGYAQVKEAAAVNYDDLFIPTNVLNVDTMFQPLFLDTFNTGSGSIDARDADIDYDSSGNGWTQRIGDADWRIDTNTAELGVAGTNPANNATIRYVYVDVSAGDFIFDADVRFDEGASGINGIMFRGSAETASGMNLWAYRLNANGKEQLLEYDDGSATNRTEAVSGAVDQTVYKLRVIANGTTVRCYRDGALKLSYTSATFNQTATWMGLFASKDRLTDKAFDNVEIFPRTDTDWDAAISAATGGTY